MINHFFETLMAWQIDNGVFYLTGRDVACTIAGVCIGIIFAYLIQYAKWLESEWKEQHKWRKKRRMDKDQKEQDSKRI